MFDVKWEIVSTPGVGRFNSDRDTLYGEWPLLKVSLSCKRKCPVCNYQMVYSSGTIDVLPEGHNIDFHVEHNVTTLLSWMFGRRECDGCGVASAVARQKHEALSADIKQVLTADELMRRFAEARIGVMPRRQRFESRVLYDVGKAKLPAKV